MEQMQPGDDLPSAAGGAMSKAASAKDRVDDALSRLESMVEERLRAESARADEMAKRLNRKIEIVNSALFPVGGVLDRKTRDTSRNAKAHAFRDIARFIGITIFKICIHRHIGRFDELLNVRQHLIASDCVVRQSARERKTGRRCRDRLESKTLKITR